MELTAVASIVSFEESLMSRPLTPLSRHAPTFRIRAFRAFDAILGDYRGFATSNTSVPFFVSDRT